jgi:hypothetical protein
MTDITYCMNTSSADVSVWNCAYVRIWRVGATYYGLNEFGIHALGGGTDEGLPIECSITTTPNDFESENLKRIPYARAEVKGAASVEVWLDGTSAGKTDMDSVSKRAKFGKGARGRFVTVRVTGSDPAFEVIELDITVANLQRGYQ